MNPLSQPFSCATSRFRSSMSHRRICLGKNLHFFLPVKTCLPVSRRNTNERPQRSTPIQKKIPAPPSNTSTSKINSDITEVLSEGYCANLCALNWQSNGHQKEPASVFASYWNGLSKADKEVYKCKAAAQVSATCHILSHSITLTVPFCSSNQPPAESVLPATTWTRSSG
ncbi:uncharacterized protein F5147DRAFT_619790 [Suillus discolor]|uniref:Uncharacterized protein n=1 Tax=Suillus discolor TaxID=1912936 RepID=A0A9P7EWA8_9AGAM|nr:uncharacterized protein F5147DRAFT_619790 [Suillus discolor]KAG2091821.1 hypothetical protein F5147DRAFT_619790 [Suillus discolor]